MSIVHKRNIMKTRNLLWLLFCTLSFISCDPKDDGSLGFMHEATVTSDSINGYYCYMDGGRVAVLIRSIV